MDQSPVKSLSFVLWKSPSDHRRHYRPFHESWHNCVDEAIQWNYSGRVEPKLASTGRSMKHI
jgi:hypothetical protein